MSVNVVRRLSDNDLELKTFRTRRKEKKDSITMLLQTQEGVEVTQNKLMLMCPYTC